jgi:abequosyltransferase
MSLPSISRISAPQAVPSERQKPVLTIAIPTYNRADRLEIALSVLVPQVMRNADVELLISDNASVDGTAAVVEKFLDPAFPNIRYHRHEANIGPDANFLSCLERAGGRYFWLCGDDDIIIEGALDRVMGHLRRADYDLVYATSYAFREDHLAEYHGDPLKRRFHVVTNAEEFASTVSIMMTFISGIIINKDRLEELPHEPPANFEDTMLVQLSWVLPLLRWHRRSLLLWDRVVAGRQGAAEGYAFGKVFGESLRTVLLRLLPDRPALVNAVTNTGLRAGFPSILYALRRDENPHCGVEDAARMMMPVYGKNVRFWLFVYPVLKLPVPLAGLWVKMCGPINKGLRLMHLPNSWLKEISGN